MKIDPKKNLSERLLAVHIVFVISLAALLVICQVIREEESLNKHLQEYGQLTTEMLRLSAVDPVVGTLAYDRLPSLLQHVYRDGREIAYIAIYSADGELVEYCGEEYPGYMEGIYKYSTLPAGTLIKKETKDGYVNFMTPLSVGKDFLGLARVGLTKEFAHAVLARDIVSYSGITLLVLLISGTLYVLLLQKWIEKPIRETSEVMKLYGETDLTTLLDKTKAVSKNIPANEVGVIAHSFEKMLEAILRQESKLRESARKLLQEKEKLEGVTRSVGAGLAVIASDHTVLWANDIVEAMFGNSVGRACYEVYEEQTERCTKCPIDDIVYGKKKQVVFEKIKTFPKGRKISLQVIATPYRDEDGNVAGILEVAVDITRLKRAEEALRKSEEKIRRIIETIPEPIVLYNEKGTVEFSNPAFTAVFGWTAEEIRGKKTGFASGEQREEKELAQLRSSLMPVRFEAKRRTKDGRVLDVIMSAAAIPDQGGNPGAIVVSFMDITEKKKWEAQFYTDQRLKAIGTLAGGIAHDFNNLLMGIQGNTSLMLQDVGTNHPHYENLRDIEQYVKLGSELTRQLLGFARSGKYDVKPTDLHRLVVNQVALFARAKKEISIYEKYEEPLWVVEVDKVQIEQVLMNLLVNAWQAMPNGGNIFVETQNVTLDERFVEPYGVPSGKYVRISVTDTGVGMDDVTIQRIFDPFFTTKDKTKGAGLGLASTYGIVRNHGGIITVSSEPSKGTTFSVYLPASHKKIAEETLSTTGEIQTGKETVLLVDDEDMILKVGERMLRSLGYKVIVANGGKRAIELFDKNHEKIDVVILDMIMPGMSGSKVYETIRETNPKVKVVLSSGYSAEGEAQQILKQGCSGFIQKPFGLKDLSGTLRVVLEK